MNTKSAMRSALATLAAGALVLGSAGAATAKPDKAKKSKQEYMQLKMVDVHNGFLNIHPDAKHRNIKVKAKVRDTVKDHDPATVTVTLAHYSAKGTPADPAAIDPVVVPLELKGKAGKKSQKYRGVVPGDDLAELLQGKVGEGDTTYICLSDADLTADESVKIKDPRRQVQKKLDRQRDCFRVINKAPDLTKSSSDDKDDDD